MADQRAEGSGKPPPSASPPLLQLNNVSKSFGGIAALKDVDFTLKAGEIHGLVGENGAGKSTTMKIIAGVYSDYEGTMQVIADAAQNAGGKIVGVSMEFFKHKARANADEMFFAKDLSERKRIMLEKSEAIVVLAGGIGTLDEATEALALKRHGDHNKPIIFLNTEGFYEGLKMQVERMQDEGFLASKDGDVVPGMLLYFADTTQDAMAMVEAEYE